ncbi:penicillin acylase family protein [Marinobacter nauticus]|uniref:penicillin acylase family protein n=1 Tax=Marinobacter nauticus TaxID=2743 RepID=UPI00241D006B|nr:penicillin acylase family protein [Marinobacter nauticus]
MNVLKSIMRMALGQRLPTWSGLLTIPDLDQNVKIRRDRYGIPTIDAVSELDAWVALGFCHGQDRSFQLELLVRSVRGTLAEVVGEEGIPMDRLARRVGFRIAGKAQLEVADDETRAQIQAYAKGITAATAQGSRKRAHEFTLLGCNPTPWEAEDVQGFIVLLCFALASNWDIELVRLKILTEDGLSALKALDPCYRHDLPLSNPPGKPAGPAIDRLSDDLAAFQEFHGLAGGSNAWAIAGSRTMAGSPILAADPHLPPTAPAPLYLAQMRTRSFQTVGLTMIGVPAIGWGHNRKLAWGLTAAHADNTDLFLERIGPDGKSVQEGDHFRPCDVRRETITVKGGSQLVEEVLVSPRGPIIGPALDGSPDAISLSASWLARRPYKAILGIHRASTPSQAKAFFEAGSASSVNLVYASTKGDIGWQLAVEIPVRRGGNGQLPMPGWAPEFGWENRVISPSSLPGTENPECGFVASANNKPEADETAHHFLGTDWLDGYRQARICEVLEERRDWTIPSSMQLQCDVLSLPWKRLRSRILNVTINDPEASRALDILRNWDGKMESRSPGATIFTLFMSEMVKRIVRAKAPVAADWALGHGFHAMLPYNLLVTRRTSHLVELMTRNPEPKGFFDSSWEMQIVDSLALVLRTLEIHHGKETSGWNWGKLRPLRLLHPFGEKKPLDRIFNSPPLPFGSDASTILQGTVDLRNPLANPAAVPTGRVVIDLGDLKESRFVVLGGQSGNPLSPHYLDQVPLWQKGEGIKIGLDEEDISTATIHTLDLCPNCEQET